MKIVTSLKESLLLTKGISATIKNKEKEQKRGFLSIFWETLAAIILRNALVGKGEIRAAEWVKRVAHNFQCHFIL